MGMRSRWISRLIISVALVAVVPAHAQQGDRAQALRDQIDRIYKTREFDPPRFGPARWLPDGKAYAIVERSSDSAGGSEIARYDAATGSRTVLVSAQRLVPSGLKSALTIDDYAWSPDGNRLLIFTNTRRVWRQNTRGDYWVLEVATGRLKKLGGDAPEASLMFAKFAPDSSRVGYVRANNVYVERLGDGRITQLTRDGSDTTINGTSDWVYEEELDVRDGFRWSPDGRRIAYWQFDTTGVGIFSLIDDTSALYPRITRIPYPKVGTTNSAVRIGVVSADGGETKWMRTPGDPREHYLARLEWIDGATLAIQQLNRLQNRNDFLLADVSDGDVKRIFRDESKTWVDVVDEVNWIDAGRAFLWVSERDGWRHVYRVPRDGGAGQTDYELRGRRDSDGRHGWSKRLAVLHGVSVECDTAVPVSIEARRVGNTGTRDAGESARNAHLRPRARWPSRLPHMVPDRQPAGDGRRRIACAPLAPAAHGSDCAQSETHGGSKDALVEFTRVDIGGWGCARWLDREAVQL